MYCKFSLQSSSVEILMVLIVAKCIVNYEKIIIDSTYELVLIVAKCIVNGGVRKQKYKYKKY